MRPGHWIRIVAMASAMGMAGAAIAHDASQSAYVGNGTTAAAGESPAAGAIVMPQDRAMLKNDSDEVRDRNGTFNDDASASNQDHLGVDPGASSDDISVDPGASRDDMSIDPGASNDGMSVDPERAESGRQPGDMGPADMRGQ